MNFISTKNISIDLLKDETSAFVINKLKEIVYRYDAGAEIILFGSRARGDCDEESDWDFLILSNFPVTNENIKEEIRKNIVNEIELATFDVVFTLFHNKKVWEEDYAVTNIYKSILEEGLAV